MLHWGASPQERHQPLPGDEIVERPKYHLTHAVPIDAPVRAVRPWLAQLGQGRGGLDRGIKQPAERAWRADVGQPAAGEVS